MAVRDASVGYDVGAREQDVPQGYKRTDVGVIPKDWESTAIATIARLESGHTPSKRIPSYWAGDVPWVSLHDTESLDGKTITKTSQTISEEGLNNSSARLLPEGTVVFSRTATVGKATILSRSMATSQDFANYVCGPELHNRFLVYLLRSMRRTWQRLMAGSIHNTIYMPVFKALKIPVPPVEEQHAIAEALSDVDGLLGLLDKLVAKKRAIKQAAMQQLLTGKTRLPGFRGEWETKRLGDLGSTFGGLTGKTKTHFGHGEARYITFLNVMTNTEIDTKAFDSVVVSESEAQNRVQQGDLFFNGSSETPEEVGMCAILLEDVRDTYLNSFCFGFRPREGGTVSGLYLAYYFRSQEGRELLKSLAQGATRYNLSKRALLAVSFPLPSEAEQTAIATVLSDIDAEIIALEQRREKTRALKQGMMQQLLTGRVRLVERAKRDVVSPC